MIVDPEVVVHCTTTGTRVVGSNNLSTATLLSIATDIGLCKYRAIQ